MRSIICLVLIFFSSKILVAQTDEITIATNTDTIQDDSVPVFIVVEEMPVFNYRDCGSTDLCFLRYVSNSIRIPAPECVGKIVIQFIVEPNGTVSNANVIYGFRECPEYKKEFERIIESMPKWTPGKQRGVAVRVQRVMPIHFDPNE